MKVRVLKHLPQGQEPGDIVDFDPDIVRAFMTPGIDAVEIYQEPEPPATRRRGAYRRHDLTAESAAATE